MEKWTTSEAARALGHPCEDVEQLLRIAGVPHEKMGPDADGEYLWSAEAVRALRKILEEQVSRLHPAEAEKPLLLGADEASRLLGIARSTFYRHHSAGRVPLPVHLGGRTLWRREELIDWVRAGCPPRSRWEWDGN